MRQLARLVVICALLGTGLLVLPASPVVALDIEVTDCQDDGAFVQALDAVQTGGGGLITFVCGPDPVTITLSGEQTISTPAPGVVIDGGGLVTLSGGNATRLFFIDNNASLELRNITLSGGNGNGDVNTMDGGAICNRGGEVAIIDSTLSENQVEDVGGAIYTRDGEVTITGSTLSGNQAVNHGSAIFNDGGEVTITSSTLSVNRALQGGTIFNGDGEVTITSSTLSGNEARYGGAIVNDGQVTITSSTLSGNAAEDHGGAIDSHAGTTTITGSTFSGNDALEEGAAIHIHASGVIHAITLHSSIIDGGESSVAACAVELGGTLESQGYNLSSDASCGLDPSLGDLPDTDPILTALDDNGGPTQTHLPQPGSPVIDYIPATECATDEEGAILPDQRGVARPQNGLCDIGSVEIVPYVLCADRTTGEIREATDSGCGRREREVSLELDGPHTVCVDRGTGELRLVSTSDACTRYEQALILPDDGPITVCFHRSTGELRVPSNDACTRYEVQLDIGGTVDL